jgi:hypothetical protein
MNIMPVEISRIPTLLFSNNIQRGTREYITRTLESLMNFNNRPLKKIRHICSGNIFGRIQISNMAAVPTLFLAFSFMAVTNEVLDVGVRKLVWVQVINISVHCLRYTVGKSYKSSGDAEFYVFVHSHLLCTESVWKFMVL